MKLTSYFITAVTVSLSLASVSCKDFQDIQSQRNEAKAKLEAMTAEISEIDQKILALKQVVPQGVVSESTALKQGEKYETALSLLEEELTKTIKHYQESEVKLKALEQETESLRKLSNF